MTTTGDWHPRHSLYETGPRKAIVSVIKDLILLLHHSSHATDAEDHIDIHTR